MYLYKYLYMQILHTHSLHMYIDSLDGLTFPNQLISILLVMPTRQHLHAILIPKNVKIRLCIF